MLYYLKQEVIGEHADSVLRGADARYNYWFILPTHTQHTNDTSLTAGVFLCRDIDIWLPEMEQQDVPSGWWDGEADRCLLIGVYKHGMCVSHVSDLFLHVVCFLN